MLCLAGVIVLAFYEGPNLKSISHHRPFLHGSNNKHGPHSKLEVIIGTSIVTLYTVTLSLWIILQVPILKEYPSKLLFGTMCTCFSLVQSFFVALIVERDFNKWKLHFDDTLIAVLYAGILVSGLALYLQVWVVEKKGPVFSAIWQPLSLLITLTCSSFFLGENIKLGSVLGGLLMVGGLYSVLWGKQRENVEKKLSTEEEIKCEELNLIYGGNYILCKDALNGGMPTSIFVFYRLFFANLVFVPFALVFGRKNAPTLSWKIAVKIFFLALFGSTFSLNIFVIGVKYSSSTVTSAISNAVPVVTFTFAVLLR
ncbi:hypothetical protein LUZ61_005736 [Rhynchospora tenuis]|uniref:WAT1-related protein n=1 Tax=Rhynchospora tenuis TaxID=198213 RepID=A0AAD5ZQ86_9POAL|nr:hypothetical protein LUZ61_005736 [Rhynchospora tenuis]